MSDDDKTQDRQAARYCEIAVTKWDERGHDTSALAAAMLRTSLGLMTREAGERQTAERLREMAEALEDSGSMPAGAG